MTEEKFIERENDCRTAMTFFRDACEEMGVDFSERIDDIIFDLEDEGHRR